MGLFSWFGSGSGSADTKRADAIRTGAAVPSRAERQRCWESRDVFFACLDRHDIIDAVQSEGARAASKACGPENVQLERDCAAQWVAHFKKYRIANHQKEKRLAALRAQGANQVQIQTGPGEAEVRR